MHDRVPGERGHAGLRRQVACGARRVRVARRLPAEGGRQQLGHDPGRACGAVIDRHSGDLVVREEVAPSAKAGAEYPDHVRGREPAGGEPGRQGDEILGAEGRFQLGERAERQAEEPRFAVHDGENLAAAAVCRSWEKKPSRSSEGDCAGRFQRKVEGDLAVVLAGIFERGHLERAADGTEAGHDHLPVDDRALEEGAADQCVAGRVLEYARARDGCRLSTPLPPRSSRQRPAEFGVRDVDGPRIERELVAAQSGDGREAAGRRRRSSEEGPCPSVPHVFSFHFLRRTAPRGVNGRMRRRVIR